MQEESRAAAPIGLGEAVETTAGDMPARWVIHAATMELGGPTSAEIIAAATRSTLERADELGARSLALVAFGTGVGGFPLEEAARLMVGAVKEHTPRVAGAGRVRGPRRRGRAGVRRRRGVVTRPVLVAPDSFKGTFSAAEVAAAVAAGLRAGGLDADRDAGGGWRRGDDGGARRLAGVRRRCRGPLGDPVDASFVLRTDGSAVVECAAASGLGLVEEAERDAWAASTYGTGELIAAAVEAGASSVLVAVGGSATTDGGAGAIEAMKEAGVAPRIEVLCDVRTPFEDAPRVFAPQKGADAAMVRRLEERLDAFAAAAPKDPRGVPMSRRGRRPRRAGCGPTSARSSCRARPTCSTRSASTMRCAPRSSW